MHSLERLDDSDSTVCDLAETAKGVPDVRTPESHAHFLDARSLPITKPLPKKAQERAASKYGWRQ